MEAAEAIDVKMQKVKNAAREEILKCGYADFDKLPGNNNNANNNKQPALPIKPAKPTISNNTDPFPSVIENNLTAADDDVSSVLSFQSNFSTASSYMSSKAVYSGYGAVSDEQFSIGFDRMNRAHKNKRAMANRARRKDSFDRICKRSTKNRKYKDLKPDEIAKQWEDMQAKAGK